MPLIASIDPSHFELKVCCSSVATFGDLLIIRKPYYHAAASQLFAIVAALSTEGRR